MNNEDRQLIAGLFDRMRDVRNLDKDQDAEAFIHQSMRDNGDSPYLLVQSVLAQEVALQEAGRRIEQLEAELSCSQSGSQTSSAAGARASSGFTGSASAVPAGQQAPWESQSSQAANAAPWGAPVGSAAGSASAVPSTGSSATGSVPTMNRATAVPPAGASRGADQSRRGGSGFLGQAMTTAAGVAGGMLLANSIGSLFGGGSTASAATPATAATDTTSGTTASDTQATDADAAQDQSGVQEASQEDDWGDDAGWGGDDDFGGGDFDI